MRSVILLTLCAAAAFGQNVPVTWDEAALAAMQTPLRDAARTPKHMASGDYNRLPALIFYKTYPVYAAGREPAGYQELLRRVEPAIAFDATGLRTPAEWARAGEAVFDAPTMFEKPEQARSHRAIFRRQASQWRQTARIPTCVMSSASGERWNSAATRAPRATRA